MSWLCLIALTQSAIKCCIWAIYIVFVSILSQPNSLVLFVIAMYCLLKDATISSCMPPFVVWWPKHQHHSNISHNHNRQQLIVWWCRVYAPQWRRIPVPVPRDNRSTSCNWWLLVVTSSSTLATYTITPASHALTNDKREVPLPWLTTPLTPWLARLLEAKDSQLKMARRFLAKKTPKWFP